MSDGWGWLGLDAPEEVLEAQAEEEAMDEALAAEYKEWLERVFNLESNKT